MGHGPRYRVPFRRRREGRTDYRRRLKMLATKRTRVVVRASLNNTVVQFLAYAADGDRVLAQGSAVDLRKQGYDVHTGNLPSAYLAGVLAGARAKKAGIGEAVLDLGDHAPVPGSRVFAALAGVLDAGVDVPHGDTVIPLEDRLLGKHISAAVAEKVVKLKQELAPQPSSRQPRTAAAKKPAKAPAAPPAKGGDKGKKAAPKPPAPKGGA